MPTDDLQRSVFSVPKMDCPSEENMIRMALREVPGCTALEFDLAARRLTALHSGSAAALLQRLAPLGLGAVHVASTPVDRSAPPVVDAGDRSEAATLRVLLAINAAMFVVELGVGVFAESTGLIADSLDMFADAAVYGLALYAVGRGARMQLRAAHLAGWLQIVLAAGVLADVGRRFTYGSAPESALMVGIGLLALAANVACLLLVARQRHRGAHMTASYIFSANDVIANAGVIVAGALVAWTGSPYPDLLIGTGIALVVLNGGRRILKLS